MDEQRALMVRRATFTHLSLPTSYLIQPSTHSHSRYRVTHQDALMGKSRDATDEERKTMRKKHFSDRDVCKYALCGLCPYALFRGGKVYQSST